MTEENTERTHDHSSCLCCQATQMMGRLFGAMGASATSAEAREHFRQSRLELLKGIRRVVDDRIEKASRTDQSRGSRIVVE